MDEAAVRRLLDAVRDGTLLGRRRRRPNCVAFRIADLGFARVDHHRALRQGRAEAVYGPGKTPEHCAAIVAELLSGGDGPVLLTRASPEQATL